MARREILERRIIEIPDPKTYLITRRLPGHETHDGFSGKEKWVVFWNGVGVLDLIALRQERPDLVISNLDGELIQEGGVPLDEYARYWRDRGFVVEEITRETAAEFRAMVIAEKKYAEEIERASARAHMYRRR